VHSCLQDYLPLLDRQLLQNNVSAGVVLGSAQNVNYSVNYSVSRAVLRSRSKADLSLALGGQTEFAESLSNIYLGYATLCFHSEYPAKGSDKVLDYATTITLEDMQDAFYCSFENFPIRSVAWTTQALAFPMGKTYERPFDKLAEQAANLITKPSEVRDLRIENIYIPKDVNDRVALLHDILPKAVKVDEIYVKMRKEKRQPTAEEKALVDEVEAAQNFIKEKYNLSVRPGRLVSACGGVRLTLFRGCGVM
jgi:hypothetical protein